MEPKRKPPAPEKVLSVADWDSPKHAVRSIRAAMIASWLLWPSAFMVLWVSRNSPSDDMRDLGRLGATIAPIIFHHRLRRNVPATIKKAEFNPWMLVLGFASAIGLLGGAIANNSRMMAIAASGMGVVFLYIFARAIREEVRLFWDPLKYLVPNKERAGDEAS